MAQYINKDALVAEIKERIKTYNKGYANGDDRRADALEVLLHDIDTLEVKEEPVSDDLEEAAKKAATQIVRGEEMFFWNDYHKFKAGANWQRRKMIGIDSYIEGPKGGYTTTTK